MENNNLERTSLQYTPSREPVADGEIREITWPENDQAVDTLSRRAALATVGAAVLGVVVFDRNKTTRIHKTGQAAVESSAEALEEQPWSYIVKEGDNSLWDITEHLYPDLPGYEVIVFYTNNIYNQTAHEDPSRDPANLDDLRVGDELLIDGPAPSNATPESE